jgi:hypothetical protein
MGMYINKTRCNNPVLCINDLCIWKTLHKLVSTGYHHDPIPVYRYISPVPTVARSVHNASVGDDEVWLPLRKQERWQQTQ